MFSGWPLCVQVFSVVVKLLNSSISQHQSWSLSDGFLLMQKVFCWKHPLDWTLFPTISLSLAHSNNMYFVLDLPAEVSI
jgi:hypothetical protein